MPTVPSINATGHPDSDTQAAVNAGIAASTPTPIGDGKRFWSVTVPPGATQQVIDIEDHLDAYRDAPRRTKGIYTVHDAGSFIAYLKKHGDSAEFSEIWADIEKRKILAVLNAPAADSPAWADHRLQLTLNATQAWAAWRQFDRTALRQKQFAEHLEDRRLDIVEPDSATLLELTRTFKAKANVEFESGTHLSRGETQLVYRETVDAKAGRKGDITIPETFKVALAPFEGSPKYPVDVRLRYAITEGALALTYVLDRPDEIVRQAFDDVLKDIDTGTDSPVFLGVPA